MGQVGAPNNELYKAQAGTFVPIKSDNEKRPRTPRRNTFLEEVSMDLLSLGYLR